MHLSQCEKAALALQSLTDSCAILAGHSAGMAQEANYDAYFVPETFWYNRVCLRPGLTGPALEETLSAIAEQVKAGKLPFLLGFAEEDYPPETMAPLLTALGYVPMVKQAGMYLSLVGRVSAPADAHIQVVPADDIGPWADAIAAAFGKPPESEGLKLLAGDESSLFLRWMEGEEMLGGTLLMTKGDLAGIHEVAVFPQHRGKGIAGKLVNYALDLAAGRGCVHATLQASEMGEGVYQRLGMETVGSIATWLLKPAE